MLKVMSAIFSIGISYWFNGVIINNVFTAVVFTTDCTDITDYSDCTDLFYHELHESHESRFGISFTTDYTDCTDTFAVSIMTRME